ncbi:MAG: hypothetical protein IJ111_05735 [Eggerthellaceae bacterium]|nr:hypothetical protein [Eggerthellaceae bacterium]
MSGVPESKRSESKARFMPNAQAIWDEVERIQSSKVTKAYRFTLSVPMVEAARSCVYNINRADKFYPNTTLNAIERRRYLTLAIADAEQLFLDLQHAKRVGIGIKDARLANLLAMVEDEMKLLKAARNNVKLIGKESPEDRREALAQELAWLEQLK